MLWVIDLVQSAFAKRSYFVYLEETAKYEKIIQFKAAAPQHIQEDKFDDGITGSLVRFRDNGIVHIVTRIITSGHSI